ncbi:MAG TPA: glycosyltransferase [Candidatus Limnocylindria bacterium]|nr:glycosyltransferase [Candidatus Limnocylindria bacterium]
MSRPSITAIIPTLNESENLPHVLPRIPAIVDEVILVDGNSTDDTVEIARQLLPSIRIVQQEGSGKGAALRTGFAVARGDIVVMLDADGSTDPAEIPAFVHALLGGADFAKGSRFLHSAGTTDMPLHRRLGNLAFVRMVRLLYGGRYTDLCYGYNAFWRRVLPYLELDGDGFEIETMMNIRALRAGLRIVEVASFEDRRVMGVGNLRTIPDGWRVLRTIWSERRRAVLRADEEPQGARAFQWVPVALPILAQLEVATAGALSGPVASAAYPEDAFMASASDPSTTGHATNGHATNGHATNGHPTSGEGVAYPTPAGLGTFQIAETPAEVLVPIAERQGEHGDTAWHGLAQGYVERLDELLRSMDRDMLARVVEDLRRARDQGSTVFLAGNGGSAATAAHWVNDLGKATKQSGQAPMRVMNLTDNVPWLTALANDEGYERVFAGQLENFARAGDVLVVISASGNSPNIIRAVETAQQFGMRTIGLVGFDGGIVSTMLDEALLIRTELGAYGLVETAHAAIADIITSCLINDRAAATLPVA